MLRRSLLLAVSVLPACAAFGQPRAVRLIVPYAPGGPIDVTARLLAERVKDSLGTVIIENKPGGGGNIGADAVAKAPPDGLTIGIAAVATHAINPWLFQRFTQTLDRRVMAQIARREDRTLVRDAGPAFVSVVLVARPPAAAPTMKPSARAATARIWKAARGRP